MDLKKAVNDRFAINLIICTVIGLFLRLLFIHQAMRYDEAYTFLVYVNKKSPDLLLYYSTPNNHIFHTVLAKLSVSVFGTDPWALRIPALIAGITMIPLAGILGKSVFNKRTGIILAYLVSIFPYLILYSTNARGYTLMTCFTILCVINLFQYFKNGLSKNLYFLGINGALGLWAVPTMAFFLTGVYMWAFYKVFNGAKKREDGFKILLVACSTILLTLGLYFPVAHYSGGYQTLHNNRFIEPQPWGEFFSQLPQHALEVCRIFSRDVPLILVILISAFACYKIYRNRESKESLHFSLLVFLLLGSGILLLVKHRVPFVRTWIFFIPLILMYTSKFIEEYFEDGRVLKVSVLLFLLQVTIIYMNRPIEDYSDTGLFPEIQEVSEVILPRLARQDIVTINLPGNFPFFYYRWSYSKRPDVDRRILDKGDIIFHYFILRNGIEELPPGLNRRLAQELYKSERVSIYKVPRERYSY